MADLYLDHNLAVEVAGLLRMSSHTVATSRDMGLERTTDDEQLLFAAQRRLIFVTTTVGTSSCSMTRGAGGHPPGA